MLAVAGGCIINFPRPCALACWGTQVDATSRDAVDNNDLRLDAHLVVGDLGRFRRAQEDVAGHGILMPTSTLLQPPHKPLEQIWLDLQVY